MNFSPHTEYDEFQKIISVRLKDGVVSKIEKIADKIDILVDQEGSTIGCRLHIAGDFRRILLDDFK